MTDHDEACALRPLTLAWVNRRLGPGERIVGTGALHGGITAEMRRLTVAAPDGGTRALVLRSFVDPYFAEHAGGLLNREADALALLAETDVPAPEPVAVDPSAAHCEYPSLLMTHLPGRTVLTDEGLKARVPLLARQLVEIHAFDPVDRPQHYKAWTTADAVVPAQGADRAAWTAAIDVIREPAPPFEGRFMHRDFHPGNVLFDLSPEDSAALRVTGVVDWVENSWGPADLDVAHCSTNLALLHGPAWGLRFAEAYEEAGGILASAAGERLYWRLLDALAFTGEVGPVVRPWQEAGRVELTTRVVEERLDAYVISLLDAPS
ncbi:phosphotransferase family protein [Streptomyces sp. NPDC101776]|uniref:phosphotransferase family protein n=1 Tax=Streptomyces sp. NPDC101776 TaxID=3366146 RepID=UPI003820AAED